MNHSAEFILDVAKIQSSPEATTDRLPSGWLSSISLLFTLNPGGLVLELSSTGSLH
jgi:hypothetical protein